MMGVPTDPVAKRDQLEAAAATAADICAMFRDALLERGFDDEQSVDLVGVWLANISEGTPKR